MLVIGLTGGIATGKSTVSTQLATRGIPVIDADLLAREVVRPGSRALKKIISTFGREVLQEDGTLDRAKLGAIIFRDEEERRKLNAIIHPAVRWGMAMGILKCWLRGERVCVLDVPLLIESKIYLWVGRVVVVYCSAELQLQRLMQRDQSTREDARARLESQVPIKEKLGYADIVMDNSGTVAELEVQVDGFARRLYVEGGWSWRVKWLIPPVGVICGIWCLIWRRVRYARTSTSSN